eukprot:351083-Chlamydomonas_euryale.AAC.2
MRWLRWARSCRAAGKRMSRGTPTRSRRYSAPATTGSAGWPDAVDDTCASQWGRAGWIGLRGGMLWAGVGWLDAGQGLSAVAQRLKGAGQGLSAVARGSAAMGQALSGVAQRPKGAGQGLSAVAQRPKGAGQGLSAVVQEEVLSPAPFASVWRMPLLARAYQERTHDCPPPPPSSASFHLHGMLRHRLRIHTNQQRVHDAAKRCVHGAGVLEVGHRCGIGQRRRHRARPRLAGAA